MNRTAELISSMIRYYAGDIKRINHFLKVYSLAKAIGENEKLEERTQEILEISAIVHDIGIKASEIKYNSSSGKYQQMEGPAIAKEMLEKFNYSQSVITRVCFLVGHHHTYRDIDGIDYQILIEADFLVNIAEDAMSLNKVQKIKHKLFKTSTGNLYLDLLYLEERKIL